MTPSTSSTIKNKEETYPLHDLAKVHNNRAAHVITTTGNYEKGINLFAKAMELTKQSILLKSKGQMDQPVPCSCKFCSLQSCLALTEERKHHHQSSLFSSSPSMDVVVEDDDGNAPSTTTNCPQQHESTNYCNSSSHYQEKKAEEDNDGGFVYRRLLLIDDQSIIENHYMGSTLSLVIIFNLALTHHLMGIDNDNTTESLPSSSNPTDLTMNIKSLRHAVKFYKLVYQLHVNYTEQQSFRTYNNTMEDDDDDDDDHDDNDTAVASVRLTMIVSNNLGQIHRVVGNTEIYTMCLQHLLSSIMYVGQRLAPNTVLSSTEFDDFVRNVSPIIFHGSKYASAA